MEPLWRRVKGVSPAPRAATSERERVEVQLFAVAASDEIVGVGGRGRTKILTSGEVSGILLKYPVQTILAGVAQWQRN